MTKKWRDDEAAAATTSNCCPKAVAKSWREGGKKAGSLSPWKWSEVVKQTVNLTVASSKSLPGIRHSAASRTDGTRENTHLFLMPKFNKVHVTNSGKRNISRADYL